MLNSISATFSSAVQNFENFFSKKLTALERKISNLFQSLFGCSSVKVGKTTTNPAPGQNSPVPILPTTVSAAFLHF